MRILKGRSKCKAFKLYEQKLEDISVKKVSEEYYASGRAYQNNNLEITYDSLTIDDVKGILSKQNIGWNEINKNRIVGHDYDTNIYLELFKERGSDKVTLILQKKKLIMGSKMYLSQQLMHK